MANGFTLGVAKVSVGGSAGTALAGDVKIVATSTGKLLAHNEM